MSVRVHLTFTSRRLSTHLGCLCSPRHGLDHGPTGERSRDLRQRLVREVESGDAAQDAVGLANWPGGHRQSVAALPDPDGVRAPGARPRGGAAPAPPGAARCGPVGLHRAGGGRPDRCSGAARQRSAGAAHRAPRHQLSRAPAGHRPARGLRPDAAAQPSRGGRLHQSCRRLGIDPAVRARHPALPRHADGRPKQARTNCSPHRPRSRPAAPIENRSCSPSPTARSRW